MEDVTHLKDADYARAEQMLAPYRNRRVPGSSLTPNWLSDGTRFWYQVGTRFVIVDVTGDPAVGRRRAAFDHDRLAAALSVESGHAVDAADLPINGLDVDEDDTVRFTAFGTRWQWSDSTGVCTRAERDDSPVPGELVSPDKAWVAFRRDGNIWVRRAGAKPGDGGESPDGAEEFALT